MKEDIRDVGSDSIITSASLSLAPLPSLGLFYSYIGPVWIIQDHLFLSISLTVVSAKFLLAGKVHSLDVFTAFRNQDMDIFGGPLVSLSQCTNNMNGKFIGQKSEQSLMFQEKYKYSSVVTWKKQIQLLNIWEKNKSNNTKNFQHVGKEKYHNTYYIALHEYLWPNFRQKYKGICSQMYSNIETCKGKFKT